MSATIKEQFLVFFFSSSFPSLISRRSVSSLLRSLSPLNDDVLFSVRLMKIFVTRTAFIEEVFICIELAKTSLLIIEEAATGRLDGDRLH